MDKPEEIWLDFFESGVYKEGWTWRVEEERTKREVDAVLSFLDPPAGAHVLDWCGGWGRHAIELAKRGYEVTLLDFAANHIRLAKQAAEAEGVPLTLIRQDFRNTPHHIGADYAINLFTSGIGYLSEEDDIAALCSLHSALKPGAKFLIDTMNLFWLIQNYNPDGWHEIVKGKVRIFESREFDLFTHRNHSEGILWQKGKKDRTYTLDHRVYTTFELAKVLREAGFEPIASYGDFDGQPLSIDSQRIILICESI